jgi:hypothetical protein
MSLDGTDLVVSNDGKAKFKVNVIGNTTMQSYFGDFECECVLSALDYINAHKEYVTYIGETNRAFSEPDQTAFELIQLKYRLKEWAPFWQAKDGQMNGSHLKDLNVISHIYQICEKAQAEYKNMMKQEYDSVKEKMLAAREKLIEQQLKRAEEEKESDITQASKENKEINLTDNE